MPRDPTAAPWRQGWCGRCPVCDKPLTVVKLTEKHHGGVPTTIIRCRCGCTTKKKARP
ncbi:hypothetical protein [Streptomyces axinellae]